MSYTNGAQNLSECDECTLRWLTNNGLQRLTQIRGEMSSSRTGDEFDDGRSFEMGARWANKTYGTKIYRRLSNHQSSSSPTRHDSV